MPEQEACFSRSSEAPSRARGCGLNPPRRSQKTGFTCLYQGDSDQAYKHRAIQLSRRSRPLLRLKLCPVLLVARSVSTESLS